MTRNLIFLPLVDQAVIVAGNTGGYLGIWNVLGDQSAICMQPHSGTVTDIGVHRANPAIVFSSSYDGSIRETDLVALEVREPFRASDTQKTVIHSFDFHSPKVLIVGNNSALATLLDTRLK